ncbi:MAG: peptidoglycan-binding protein [Ruminococcus sp.]
MLKIKKVLSLFLVLAVILTILMVGITGASAAGTGTGLAEHALNAYYSGWSYVYGAASVGAVDCSGLIYMYSGTGSRVDMMGSSPETGSVYNGIPNIHGLGLYEPGHVGVYVGGGMAVDARSEDYGVCYQSAYSKGWTNWFKVAGVSYPTTGWEYFNGNYYYYENGEYLTDTYITVDGISYYLDSTGASSSAPGDTSGVADSGNSGTASESSSSGSSGASSSTPTVYKNGSMGDKVIEIQYRLIELGFYAGEVTGYFGDQTEAAYRRFQEAAGLYVDGIAGSDMDVLFSSSAPTGTPAEVENEETAEPTDSATDTTVESSSTTYTNGDFSDGVYEIQNALAGLGYFNDDATGYYGDMTESAVAEFQLHNGLDSTGEVDELTYAALFSSTALENPNSNKSNGVESATKPENTQSSTAATDASVSATESTEMVYKSVQLSSKALEGVNVQSGETVETGSNRSVTFIVWLAIMIIFMVASFWFVFSAEKKKKKARYERIKARANRNW